MSALAATMDYVFFLYGLSFVLLGVVAAMLGGREPTLPWGWLAAFGLFHGLQGLSDLLALSLGDSPAFKAFRVTLQLVSFLALLEFGRLGLPRTGYRSRGRRLYIPLLALAGLGALAGPSGLSATSRYALALPGGLLAGWILWRMARQLAPDNRLGLRLAALSLLLYAPLAGLVVSGAAFFPASWLNEDRFLAAAGFPVQIPRMLGALGVMAGLWLHGARLEPGAWRSGPISRWLYPAMFVLLLGLGGFATDWQGRSADAEFRERLLRQATEIAQTLDPQLARVLSFTAADRGTPAFERVRAQMSAYGRFIRQRSIYSMAIRDGVIVFGPENLAENDPLASPPGTRYERAPPQLRTVFQDARARAVGPFTDEYGTFVSAFAPMLDPRGGEVLMVIGLDIPADTWIAWIAKSRLFPILGTLALFLILLAGIGAIQWRGWQPANGPSHWRHVETALVGVLGLVLTGTIVFLAQAAENREHGELFQRLASARAGTLRELLDAIQADLATLARFHDANPRMTRAEFRAFVAPMVRTRAVQAYEWVPRVAAAEKTRFEANARQTEISGFTIWERNLQGGRVPGSGRANYYPVYYLEPLTGNEPALGFDLGSEPVRLAALSLAIRTGLITATDPVILVQEIGQQKGVVVFQPVFANPRTGPGNASGAGTATVPRGFALGVLRMQSLLDRAMLQNSPVESSEIAVHLMDLTVAGEPASLAAHAEKLSSGLTEVAGGPRLGPSPFQTVHPLFAFGRAYAVVTHPTPAFHAAHPARTSGLAAVAGLFLTTVLTVFVGFLRDRQALLEHQVRERTAELRESEEQFRSYYELGLIGMAITSLDQGWVQFNDRLCAILGYAREELATKNWADLTHPDDLEADVAQFRRILAGEIEGYVMDKRFIRRDGEIVHTVLSVRCVRRSDGSVHHFVAMVQDITERKRAEEALREREATLHSITDSARDAIVMMDAAGRISFWNPAAEHIFGYSRDEALGRSLHQLLAPARYHDAYQQAFPEFQCTGRGDAVGRTLRLQALRKNGSKVAVALSLSAVRIRNEWHAVGILRDETERQARERELRRLATTDPLTGLPNRRHFLAQVEWELERFKRYAKPAALLMFDLDHFKRVNDTYGHAAGDAVLKHFAVTARRVLRKIDLLGRLGGEEFAALLPGTDQTGAQQLAERLRQTVAITPIRTEAGEIRCTVSLGVTLISSADLNADAILARADRALYRAKDGGRNRVELELPA